ncbi:MAG: RNA polymerase sigma factor [Chitinophagaceae bacterium]|nr:RNA polymerase sigma factor [Chitinophagaceae bacterium]
MTAEEKDIQIIIEGCKKEDRRSQEQLYRNYYRAMMNLCLRYTKNERDALEALNTGFYKVYKNIHRFDVAKASLYTWIRTIIINSCLDLIKKTNKTLSGAGELEQAANVHVPPAAISRMSAQDILLLVRQLPPATQAVFNLYVMEGYNHGEIASIAGISEGTSKWHLSEARKKLQALINEQTV